MRGARLVASPWPWPCWGARRAAVEHSLAAAILKFARAALGCGLAVGRFEDFPAVLGCGLGLWVFSMGRIVEQ